MHFGAHTDVFVHRWGTPGLWTVVNSGVLRSDSAAQEGRRAISSSGETRVQEEENQGGGMGLRKAAIVLAVMNQLSSNQHGYAIQRSLADLGLPLSQGTLYSLLNRLEEQGFLDSTWSSHSSRQRRVYELSADGQRRLNDLRVEWSALVSIMGRILITNTVARPMHQDSES